MARLLELRDLGSGVDYAAACELLADLSASRAAGRIPDTLLLLEHAPVYTLGRSGDPAHVLWSGRELAAAGIRVCRSTRGGDVTYHGPGQLVGYPVVHLGDAGLSVLGYVEAIETVLIRTAAGFGVTARRDARNRGVWVGNDKLAALGIRVSRQVASHGFAFNVAPRLDHYRGIVACGLKGAGVTSLAAILGRPPDMTEVRRTVVAAFCDVLGYESPAV